MRRVSIGMGILVALGWGASCSRGGLSVPSGSSDDGLVVHEWGTYTSVQGSDGVTLEGLQHEEEALPSFVLQRAITPSSDKGIESLPGPVNQKLETPVLYFYSGRALDVRATVDFPGGIISQWYPDAAAFTPAIGSLSAIADGHMEWQANLRPASLGNDVPTQSVPADSVWAPSRRTAATPVVIGKETEKFIFYRGLGHFDVPLAVRTGADGLLEARNDSDEDIADAFLLYVHDGAGTTVPLGRIAAHGARTGITPPAEGKEHDLDAFVAATMDQVAAALERSGLYADEARAMVETWSRSYFRSPGLRLLYVAPRAWTDRLLPLSITPTPQAIVRTLVGRVEVFTRADEQALIARAASEYPDTLISSLGRFAEPKLRRARALATDPTAQFTLDNAIRAAASLP